MNKLNLIATILLMGNVSCGPAQPLSVEYVIAHYKEDLNWLSPVLRQAIIYHKGPDDFPRTASKDWIALPNLGREGHTYLTHIIKNYDNLAEVTVFLQGSVEDHSHARNWLDLAREAKQNGFSSLTPIVLDYETDDFTLKGGKYDLGLHPAKIKMSQFYKEVLGVKPTSPLPATHNGCFAVHRDRILKNHRNLYKHILGYLDNPNPEEGHFLERAWYCMFNNCPDLGKK